MILVVLAALPAARLVKGKANDPLQHVSWWNGQYHSGVLVLSLSTLIGVGALYAADRNRFYRRWAFALIGMGVGAFPCLFYSVATPARDLWWVPLGEMLVLGLFWGMLIGLLLFYLLKREASDHVA